MRVFNIREHYDPDFGEHIIGSREIGRHSIYLVFGDALAGETRQLASPGHEEILLLLSGEARLGSGSEETTLGPDAAVYLEAGASVTLLALTDCRYVVAGGHPAPHDH